RVVALLRHELRPDTGRAAELAPAARLQLDVVDHRAGGDVAEGKGVPRADVGRRAAHHRVAHPKAGRREEVALLAVDIVQQGDAGRAVGVVLDGGDLRRDAVLLALEVDDSVAALVPAADVAGGDAAVVVATARLVDLPQEALLRARLRDLLE